MPQAHFDALTAGRVTLRWSPCKRGSRTVGPRYGLDTVRT
jgi:hypothetical protein